MVFILPKKIWEKWNNTLKTWFNRYILKAYRGKSFYGQQLLAKISEINTSFKRDFGKENSLPQYKYFTSLIEQLINFSRVYGTRGKVIGDQLRNILIADIRWEKKNHDIFSRSFAQMGVLMLAIWGFIFLSSYILKKSFLSMFELYTIFLFQIAGAFLYTIFIQKLRKNTFIVFEKLSCTTNTIMSLSLLDISFGHLLKIANLGLLTRPKNNNLRSIYDQLHRSILRWKNYGESPQSDLNYLVEELYFIQGSMQEKLMIKILGVKFLILAIFFMGSYFYFLYGLISNFDIY